MIHRVQQYFAFMKQKIRVYNVIGWNVMIATNRFIWNVNSEYTLVAPTYVGYVYCILQCKCKDHTYQADCIIKRFQINDKSWI